VKNLAGNDVAIFLFRFDLSGNGINFILNEAIAADMYEDIDKKMRPLIHTCCETLLRYKHLSSSNTIMDGNFLVQGSFEVTLSRGLGSHFPEDEKQELFQDAKNIADLLALVMNRRTVEKKQGIQRTESPTQFTHNPKELKKGFAKLGQTKRLKAEWQRLAEDKPKISGLRQLRPEDLPPDVIASSGYDHRGFCYIFEHKTLGDLGRIILIKKAEQQVLIEAELFNEQETSGSPRLQKKKEIFEAVISAVNNCFNENFGYG
jgi:hypothetical protein